jgi:hypothetical protein
MTIYKPPESIIPARDTPGDDLAATPPASRAGQFLVAPSRGFFGLGVASAGAGSSLLSAAVELAGKRPHQPENQKFTQAMAGFRRKPVKMAHLTWFSPGRGRF